MNRLVDRVCLVTGSTGIAAAAAARLAAEGAAVFVVSRTAEHARALAERIATAGGTTGWSAADLTDDAAADAVVAACADRFGRIDGLFAVAGGSGRRFGDGPIHAVARDAWDRTLALNLTTQATICRAVVARMRAQEPNGSGTRGSILLMGSVTATDPAPEFFATHAYAAARGATNALMTTMAATYLADRIRVNVVAPGLTRTPMAQRAAGDAAIRAYGARKQPLAGELMDPDEVAHAAVFLLSDESRAITGQLLKVDGGWSVASVSPLPAEDAE
ncbi:MAG TPA: SDR family oxidoreductase [Candidatus Limnocylindrales bacterium]|jgi:NAD(P)-dependent dehydrogenase (short-subunit alcohol dehydrogenase family)